MNDKISFVLCLCSIIVLGLIGMFLFNYIWDINGCNSCVTTYGICTGLAFIPIILITFTTIIIIEFLIKIIKISKKGDSN